MKAIITDLDRTLLRTDKSMSEKTISILKKVRQNGIKVMFATARPRRAIAQYEELLHPDSVVTNCSPELPEGCGSIFKILVSNQNTNLNEHINSIVTEDSY